MLLLDPEVSPQLALELQFTEQGQPPAPALRSCHNTPTATTVLLNGTAPIPTSYPL